MAIAYIARGRTQQYGHAKIRSIHSRVISFVLQGDAQIDIYQWLEKVAHRVGIEHPVLASHVGFL